MVFLSLFLGGVFFALISFQGMSVVSDNADEVGVEAVNDNCDEQGPEEVLFLWESVVSGLFSSGNDLSVFVPGVEVDDIPKGKGGVWDNNENVWVSNSSSGAVVVRVEEFDKEAGSDNCWYKEEYGNKYKPPVDVIIENKVENLDETWKNKQEGKDSGGNNTALDWETSETWKILGSFIRAGADAAAAYFWLINSSVLTINYGALLLRLLGRFRCITH